VLQIAFTFLGESFLRKVVLNLHPNPSALAVSVAPESPIDSRLDHLLQHSISMKVRFTSQGIANGLEEVIAIAKDRPKWRHQTYSNSKLSDPDA